MNYDTDSNLPCLHDEPIILRGTGPVHLAPALDQRRIQNMARPRLSDDTAAHINDIYREYTEQEPPDFETALATVLELASAKLEDDRGWRPGDYAKKTMQMVVDDTTKRSAQPSRSPSVITDHAEFRAVLDDDGRVEIPIGERRALELESDDLLEVTVRKFERDNDE